MYKVVFFIGIEVLFTIILVVYFAYKRTKLTKERLINEERIQVYLDHTEKVLFSNVLEADITRDKLIGQNCRNLTKLLGIRMSASYTETIHAISNKLTHPDYKVEYQKILSKEHILEVYARGTTTIDYECIEKSDAIEYRWIMIHIYIFKSKITNTIRIISFVKNIEKEKQEYLQLKSASELDLLTNVYNKVAFQQQVESRRSSYPLENYYFIIIDIDDFKKINDEYGHLEGDKVLIKITDTLKSVFDTDAIIGRIGGDEFSVFLTDKSGIEILNEKVTLFYELLQSNDNISDMDKQVGTIEVSMGMHVLSKDEKFEDIYKKADQALYQAKFNGKNQLYRY